MSNKQRIAILGAGCHGKVLLDAILAGGQHEVAGFLDDDTAKQGQHLLGFPILGTTSELRTLSKRQRLTGVALGIGDNYLRYEKLLQVQAAGLKPVSVIHPGAHISRFAELGEAVVVLACAVVNPGAVLEENVCVNTAASVDHDVHLYRHCHVYPGATLTGMVSVGEFSYIGSGATVIPGVRVGAYSYVGAGATVIAEVPDGVVVAGVPARQIVQQAKRPAHMLSQT
jgi:sugar O-acyltransferase (sialic acid O-acetyltransferase NeuD family)